METTEKRGSDVIATFFGQENVKPVNGTPVLEPNAPNDHWLHGEKKPWRQIAQEIANKRISRAPEYANMAVNIDKVNVHLDGNLTFVIIDSDGDQVVGWSKFNPKDIRLIDGKSKKGNYWFRKESKYREMAGIMKAIERAVDKLLNP